MCNSSFIYILYRTEQNISISKSTSCLYCSVECSQFSISQPISLVSRKGGGGWGGGGGGGGGGEG